VIKPFSYESVRKEEDTEDKTGAAGNGAGAAAAAAATLAAVLPFFTAPATPAGACSPFGCLAATAGTGTGGSFARGFGYEARASAYEQQPTRQ